MENFGKWWNHAKKERKTRPPPSRDRIGPNPLAGRNHGSILWHPSPYEAETLMSLAMEEAFFPLLLQQPVKPGQWQPHPELLVIHRRHCPGSHSPYHCLHPCQHQHHHHQTSSEQLLLGIGDLLGTVTVVPDNVCVRQWTKRNVWQLHRHQNQTMPSSPQPTS